MTASRATSAMLAIASVTLTASPAFARWGAHPRRAEVNGRLWNQNERIRAGVRDGQLSQSEARQLRADDRGIYHEEHEMASFDGGHITKADQRSLNQQENAVSKDIYTDRHN
ncbi:hypothetical protein [Sphingomonas sp.]|uniref:hypothetical protein n=1 Tax=Sphingomonas sp. TaxID=28214 RepID=UPI0025E2DC49|nr:hypothetical protein [Sphingomonas sp.]MBV9527341.1 hypothetical protein [Sphingomonas sp.]